MRLPKSLTAALVPLVAAIAPAALSAILASSRRATMFASLQLPEVLAELAAIAEVSPAMVLDAAVVSAALLSFLPHATTAKAATASIAALDLDTTIVPSPSKSPQKTAPVIEAALVVLSGIRARSVHTAFFPLLREPPTADGRI